MVGVRWMSMEMVSSGSPASCNFRAGGYMFYTLVSPELVLSMAA